MEASYKGIKFSDSDIVNPDDWTGGYHDIAFLLHDHGFVCAIVLADCLQDALDEAVDGGKLTRYKITDVDRADYSDDSERIDYLGNFGVEHDIESLGIEEIPTPIPSFCAAFQAERDDE